MPKPVLQSRLLVALQCSLFTFTLDMKFQQNKLLLILGGFADDSDVF